MAPALTDTPTDGHSVHLSSPLGPSGMDLDGPLLGMDLDLQQMLMEDDCAHTAWMNLTVMPSPDAFSKDALDLQTPFLSPLVQPLVSYRTMLHSSPGTLLNLLSLNKSLASPLLPCSPSLGVYFLSVPDQDDQDTAHCFLSTTPQQSPLRDYSLDWGESLAYSTLFALSPVKGGREVGCDLTQAQSGSAELEATVLDQTQQCCIRQEALLGQSSQVQKRLQALLGEHASRHCSLQLGGLIEACSGGDSPQGLPSPLEPHSTLDTNLFDTPVELEKDEEGGPDWSRLTLSPSPPKVPSPLQRSADVQTFISCAQGVMSRLQDALDSDATESSSEEELDLEGPQGTTSVPVYQACEREWQAVRAEIGSRWTWLQVRMSELDYKVKQLNSIQRQISSVKGDVVLAKVKPLRNKKIQQTLLDPPIGRDFTSDTEVEPSSPTGMLRNIESQSAQMTDIINSLMTPFNLSPSSSPTAKPSSKKKRRRKRALSSDHCVQGDPPFPGQVEQKKRRVCRRRQKFLRLERTCISARTRPLLSYHKPRLFTLDPPTCPRRQQDPEPIPSTSTAMFTNSLNPSKPLSRGRYQWVEQMRPQPFISLTPGISLPILTQSALYREDRVQQPPPLRTEQSSSFRRPGFENKEACFLAPSDGNILLSKLSEPSYCLPPARVDTPPDRMIPRAAQTPTQSLARQCVQGEGLNDSNNISTSLVASSNVDRQQYKDILTPSWRIVNIQPLEEKDWNEDEMEDLSDDAFSQRHQKGEYEERLCWSSWVRGHGQRRSYRLSGSNTGSIQEFQLPWEQRVFPLCEEEEEKLTPEEDSLTSLHSDSEETAESLSTDTCSEHSFSCTNCFTASPSTAGKRTNILKVDVGNNASAEVSDMFCCNAIRAQGLSGTRDRGGDAIFSWDP